MLNFNIGVYSFKFLVFLASNKILKTIINLMYATEAQCWILLKSLQSALANTLAKTGGFNASEIK